MITRCVHNRHLAAISADESSPLSSTLHYHCCDSVVSAAASSTIVSIEAQLHLKSSKKKKLFELYHDMNIQQAIISHNEDKKHKRQYHKVYLSINSIDEAFAIILSRINIFFVLYISNHIGSHEIE